MIEIKPVRGRRMTTRFLEMPRPIYRNDSNWIPPLTTGARKFMNPKANPYFREADIDHFVAVDGGRVLGRISATIEPAHVERHGKVGFFGWFETVDDQDVAAALVGRVEDWARERGMERLAGPYSYCATQEFGLLVDGGEEAPAAFQPHNPAYYRTLLSALGYTPSYGTDTFSWYADRDADALKRVLRRGEKAQEKYGLAVRSLDPTRWDAEIDLVYELFAASFADSHDMVPMSRPVFDFQVKEIKAFLDPELIRFVSHQGRPVGFSLLMADANEILKVAQGKVTPGLLLSFKKLRREVQGTVVLMIGARPEAEGIGIGRVLGAEIARVGLGQVGNYRAVHSTWIHQDNWQSRALVTQTGSKPVRTYAVYEKELAA